MAIACDVAVFGGGIAGLWIAASLRRLGWSAVLFESRALGAGQTGQSQGIIHGGGKYALRGVGDLEAVKAIAEMPDLWRESHEGKRGPDLRAARIVSEECLLWQPKGSFLGDLAAKGEMAIVTGAGLLATKPEPLPRECWPEVLRNSALQVFTMAEPVFDARSLVEALAAGGAVQSSPPFLLSMSGFRIGDLDVRARAAVFAAGEGNEALCEAVGAKPGRMQRRPLTMFLLRGSKLPRLYGHCVVHGKTQLTITSVQHSSGDAVWQVGGEVAEKMATEMDEAVARRAALEEIRRWLPDLPLDGVRIGIYRAVRAEAATSGARRPSGVHVERVADQPPCFAAWPTKLALAPLLADDVVRELTRVLGGPLVPPPDLTGLPVPPIAPPPWETATWHSVA